MTMPFTTGSWQESQPVTVTLKDRNRRIEGIKIRMQDPWNVHAPMVSHPCDTRGAHRMIRTAWSPRNEEHDTSKGQHTACCPFE